MHLWVERLGYMQFFDMLQRYARVIPYNQRDVSCFQERCEPRGVRYVLFSPLQPYRATVSLGLELGLG